MEDMVKIMRDESRRVKKNETRIDHLMTQTFADRRKMVVSEGVSTAELKERFPCLFNEHQVLDTCYFSVFFILFIKMMICLRHVC